MTTRHDATPIAGYSDGLIISHEPPSHSVETYDDDRADNHNDWFYLENHRFNVHPYRADFGGWPVRWIETINYDVDQMIAFDTGADIDDGLTDSER